MIGAVGQFDADIHHGKPEWALLQVVGHADLDRRNELPRDGTSDDGLTELEPRSARQRADLDNDVAELAMPAGLLLVPAANLDRFADRLLVRNLTGLRLGIDAVFPPQAFQGDAQMHLTLAPQHHLMGILGVIETQRRILLHQPRQGRRQLYLILAIPKLDGKSIHGLWLAHGGNLGDPALFRGDGFARQYGVEPSERNRIARLPGAALPGVLSDEREDPGDALFGFRPVQRRAVGDLAGQDAGH